MLLIYDLRRDRLAYRRQYSAEELVSYHKWADEHIFKEVKKPEFAKLIRERVKKYGKTRYQIVLD